MSHKCNNAIEIKNLINWQLRTPENHEIITKLFRERIETFLLINNKLKNTKRFVPKFVLRFHYPNNQKKIDSKNVFNIVP